MERRGGEKRRDVVCVRAWGRVLIRRREEKSEMLRGVREAGS
jgi:hypothetical protein